MPVTIRNFTPEDHVEWLRLRKALWEDCADEQHVREMEEILNSDVDQIFFAERPGGGSAASSRRPSGPGPTVANRLRSATSRDGTSIPT